MLSLRLMCFAKKTLRRLRRLRRSEIPKYIWYFIRFALPLHAETKND